MNQTPEAPNKGISNIHNSSTNSSDPSDASATMGTRGGRKRAHASTPKEAPSYADRESRISKENLFMALALWMERFPATQVARPDPSKIAATSDAKPDPSKVEATSDAQPDPSKVAATSDAQPDPSKITATPDPQSDPFKKVGALLVLPDDILYAAECSRDDVHGVTRLLMKHHNMAQGCKVFVSRKPCSFCTKLLVQSKVKRVFYLPIEPEYIGLDKEKFEAEKSCVDNLFKVSAIGETTFVPRVEEEVVEASEKKKKTKTPIAALEELQRELFKTYWEENWMARAKDDLPWLAFDEIMKKQVESDFNGLFKWMAHVFVGSEKGYKFEALNQNGTTSFDPAKNELDHSQASFFITFAKFLAERTDEPTAGVGAVVINKDHEIVAIGWNGFPTKALYGEFARASRHDASVKDKKYPYSIHAEQNALLLRNTKDFADGTLFVTKTPCDECTPLLQMQGIKTVVICGKMQNEQRQGLSYQKFDAKVKEGIFICFETKNADDKPEAVRAKKKLPL